MAKVIIEQNNRICLPGKGMVAYTDPVVEVRCGDLVPDATIIVNGQPVYIEIVVTNPIHPPKIEKYRLQQAKVLIIRLTEEDRDSDFETLSYMVLEEPEVREWLFYAGAEVKSNESSLWAALVVGLLGVFVWSRAGRRRKR